MNPSGELLHAAWRDAMVGDGFADHQFDPGAVYRNACVGHVLVPQLGGGALSKPCPFAADRHHPDIRDWAELPEARRNWWETLWLALDFRLRAEKLTV